MANNAVNWARVQRIHRTPKAVLMTLAERANQKAGYTCFPGQESLARDTNLSVRTVRYALAYLEEMGFITRSRRSRKNGARSSDEFEVLVDDREINIQPYSEWLANRQPKSYAHKPEIAESYRQGIPVLPAGPAGECEPEVNQKDSSTSSTTSSSLTSLTSLTPEGKVMLRVTQNVIDSVADYGDDELFEMFMKASKTDLSSCTYETDDLREAHARLVEVVTQEAKMRFLGSDR